MTVIVTAGHVDHGKSALVKALTGTDPDRFEEERRRGLTIDLGFGAATLPSGRRVSFVDVPGHHRFVANMLAGIGPGGAAGCLLVIDASEGWRTQSEEHLRVVDVLGVPGGVIALSKSDLVDAEMVELQRDDVATSVEGTVMAAAPVVAVSAHTGAGLDELRLALDDHVERAPAALDRGRPRLWIDRVFVAAGSGTVVTGTLTDGELRAGDEVAYEPGGRRARIRAIEEHGEPTSVIDPGHRAALNLGGVAHTQLRRGMAVVRPGAWHLSTVLDVELCAFPTNPRPLARRGAYVAHIGTAEVPVRLRVVDGDGVAPGERGLARLRLATAVPCLPGDRYVLRETGRDLTVGGGEVLDVAPVLPASRAAPSRDVNRVVAEHGWIDATELALLTDVDVAPTVGSFVVSPGALAEATADLRARIDTAGALGIDVATLDERHRALVPTLEGVVVASGRARAVEHAAGLDDHPVVEALRAAGVQPEIPDVDRAVLRQLQRAGRLVERDGLWFHPAAIDIAARCATELLGEHSSGFTVSQFRERLGVSRRHALPLLAELDARRLTRRAGDVRVAGAAARY